MESLYNLTCKFGLDAEQVLKFVLLFGVVYAAIVAIISLMFNDSEIDKANKYLAGLRISIVNLIISFIVLSILFITFTLHFNSFGIGISLAIACTFIMFFGSSIFSIEMIDRYKKYYISKKETFFVVQDKYEKI